MSKIEMIVANTEVDDRGPLYLVVKVVDGDTISVKLGDTTEKIRLIGIDTPETVDPRKSVQCFGKEASNKAKELLNDKQVYLEADTTQGERDKYDRLLRYVILEDGTNFNKKMIRDGYAHEYTYDMPYKYQEDFKNAQREAREDKIGLWSDDTCSGDTEQSASSASAEKDKSTTIPATVAPKVAPKAVAPTNDSGGGFVCNCSKTCKYMSCAEAQFQLNTCGCAERDGNDDGIACNAQCR